MLTFGEIAKKIGPQTFQADESASRGLPGTALTALLAELGLKQNKSCGCKSQARQMDAWGIAGCRDTHRAEIVAWLNAQARAADWRDKLVAGLTAARLGILINPLAPGESLLNAALKRAEAQVPAT